jgi:uncharacterized membrane protein YebE (DUF533 family)
MSFGNILGQILQEGLGGQTGTRDRVETTARSLDDRSGAGGGGLDAIFGQLQGALSRAGVDTAGAGQAASGFRDKAGDFLRQDQVGGLSGAQIGGIGAIAGALLGGGLGGAARGGAMAVLGTLALGALKRAQAERAGQAEAAPLDQSVGQDEIRALTAPETERLLLKAMISAAKSDGNIDQAEMQKIIGKISADDITAEEKQFVLDQMSTPIDVAALAAEARQPAQAAEVYAASILAIDADSEQERRYLADLAAALNLDAETVRHLHRMTGAAPAA